MRLLLHVPARGGSKGLPGKNLCRIGGKSLVRRAIEAGQSFLEGAGLSGRILVDTDDARIADEAARAGAPVPFLRPDWLARDETPTLDTVLHAIDRLEEAGESHDVLVLLQPTSPLRRAGDIAACWERFDLRSRPSIISVVAAAHPPELSMRLDEGAVIRWAFGSPAPGVRRQDLPPAFRPNGAVYIDSVAFLREHRSFVVEGRTIGVEMPAARSIDVDDAFDLAIAAAVHDMKDGPDIPVGCRPQTEESE
jgi:CMP-N,N'-diacetyllegionaminic acid synthase